MPKIRRQYTGGAVAATLASPIGASSVVSFNVAGGVSPSGWPTSSATPFYVVLSPQTSAEEKMLVTLSGATLTIVARNVDGTSASSHASGASIYPVFTAIDASEANELTSTYVSQGSMVYQGASTFTELPISGTAGQALITSGGVPAWGQVPAAGIATGAVTSDKILDGTILDIDVNASAAIAQSKISGLTTSLSNKLDGAATAVNSSKISGKTVFVQQAQPTALATGDIWFQVTGIAPL